MLDKVLQNTNKFDFIKDILMDIHIKNLDTLPPIALNWNDFGWFMGTVNAAVLPLNVDLFVALLSRQRRVASQTDA